MGLRGRNRREIEGRRETEWMKGTQETELSEWSEKKDEQKNPSSFARILVRQNKHTDTDGEQNFMRSRSVLCLNMKKGAGDVPHPTMFWSL